MHVWTNSQSWPKYQMSFMRKWCFVNCNTGWLASFFKDASWVIVLATQLPVQISKGHLLSHKSQTEMSAGTKEVKYMSEARLDEIKAGSRGSVAKWKVCAPSKVAATSWLQRCQLQAPPCLVLLFFRRSEDSGNLRKFYKPLVNSRKVVSYFKVPSWPK